MFARARSGGESHVPPELLCAYLDKQVTPQELGRVEQHLRACAGCARDAETLRYTTALLRATPQLQVPHVFTLSEAEVERSTRRTRARRLSYYLQGASAAIAALLIVVVVGDVLPSGLAPQSAAPAPMVAEKAVVRTVVVEREVEAPAANLDATAASPAEAPLAAALAPSMTEEPVAPEAELKALSLTPTDEILGMGGGQEEALRMAAAAEGEAIRETSEKRGEEPPAIPAEPELSVEASPAATPVDTAVPLQAPTEALQALLETPETGWTLSRLLEVGLGSLVVVLLGVSFWLRRWR